MSVEKALLFVFLEREGLFPDTHQKYLPICSGSPGKAPAQETAGLQQNPAYKCQFAAIRMSANCQIPDCHSTNSF